GKPPRQVSALSPSKMRKSAVDHGKPVIEITKAARGGLSGTPLSNYLCSQGGFMTKINRRLLSGASLAALGVGMSLVPVDANAFVGTTINNSPGFTTSAWGGVKESITGIVVSNTGGAGDVTVVVNNSSQFIVTA